MGKIFVDACLGKETPYTPIWMMRQAGRYLTEYMAVRAEAGNFLNLCHDPKKAAEVTIQPLDIVGVDAAILFSDILVIPDEMGMDLSFVKGEGPKFSDPLTSQEDLDRLIGGDEAASKLTYVFDTIKLLRTQLDERGDDKALIGFTGAPWTLATYMIEGQGTKTYNICKKMMYSNPELLHNILAKVTEVVKLYMEKQIEALSNLGLLSRFVGMLTDSRSFLSYPRHEYFRRILCNILGNDIENGLIPNNMPLLGDMVKNICFNNAKNYFAIAFK